MVAGPHDPDGGRSRLPVSGTQVLIDGRPQPRVGVGVQAGGLGHLAVADQRVGQLPVPLVLRAGAREQLAGGRRPGSGSGRSPPRHRSMIASPASRSPEAPSTIADALASPDPLGPRLGEIGPKRVVEPPVRPPRRVRPRESVPAPPPAASASSAPGIPGAQQVIA